MTEEAVLQLHKRCFIFLSVSKALVKRLLYCTHLFGGANRASFASPTFISCKGLCNVIKSFCSRTDIYLWKHHKEKDFFKNPSSFIQNKSAGEGIWPPTPTLNQQLDEFFQVGGKVITTGTLTDFISSFTLPHCLEPKHGRICMSSLHSTVSDLSPSSSEDTRPNWKQKWAQQTRRAVSWDNNHVHSKASTYWKNLITNTWGRHNTSYLG